jgi:hypothetical protein
MYARLARQLLCAGSGSLNNGGNDTPLQAEQKMNTTILNYPGFQTLPKGVKQMLLVSEAYFFDQPASHHQEPQWAAQEMRADRDLENSFRSPLINTGIAMEA